MARLVVVSGVGAKGPACFLVESGGRRLLLDLGEGPDAGVVPDLRGVGPVDAILLSHGHPDHAGGLAAGGRLGNPPIHATVPVLEGLPPPASIPGCADRHRLPARGVVDVLGIRVETGRAGHAPGGVWLHLAVGEGLLYLGDACRESTLYAFDPPPPADTVVVDASYGIDDTGQEERRDALAPWFDRPAVVFPVPAGGRGPEIALHLLDSGRAPPALDAANRAAVAGLLGVGAPWVRMDAAAGLRRLLAEAPHPDLERPSGVILAATADAAAGLAGRLAARWPTAGAGGPDFVFTGHLGRGTPGERMVEEGRAVRCRWNVHPRLCDNVALARAVGAARVIPAFGAARHHAAWQAAFAPARVVLERDLRL